MDYEKNNGNDDITMIDVALRAGVSQATVSRALSNHSRINSRTREAVIKAVRELGYRHAALNDEARKDKQATIGLFMCPLPEQKNPLGLDFFGAMIAEIQEVAAENHLEIVLTTLPAEADNLAVSPAAPEKFSGMILLGYPSAELTAQLRRRGVKYVVVSGDDNIDKNSDLVTVNNLEGGMEACRYLLSRGHRRIGMIMTQQDTLRLDGFQLELMKHRLALEPRDLSIVASTDISSFIEVIHRWIAAGDLPEALVISFYDAAATVKTMLTLNGIRVPEAVELFTFKHRSGDTAIPGMRQAPSELLGRKAVVRLLELMRYPDDPPHRIIVPMSIEL